MSKGIKVNKEFEKEVIRMEFYINFRNKPLGFNSDYLIPFLDSYFEDSSDFRMGVLVGLIYCLSSIDAISCKECNRLFSIIERL